VTQPFLPLDLESANRAQTAGSVTMTTESSIKYVCITTNQPDTKSKSNPYPNPTTKQHAMVNIQLNVVTYPTYPEKFIQGYVVALFVPTSVVIVTMPRQLDLSYSHIRQSLTTFLFRQCESSFNCAFKILLLTLMRLYGGSRAMIITGRYLLVPLVIRSTMGEFTIKDSA